MGVIGGAAAVAGAVRASRGRHPLGQRIAAVLPMVRDTLRGRWAGAPKGRVLGGLAGLAYVISPLDFIPEVLLGPFGLGDDLAIAAVSVAALLSSAEDWLDARDAAAAMGPTATAGASTRATQGDVIQGVVVERPSSQLTARQGRYVRSSRRRCSLRIACSHRSVLVARLT